MSSNARNGFMGWVQKNPGKAFAAFLVLAVIITIIVMVVRRGSGAGMGPGSAGGLPVLEVSGAKVVNSTKKSGYAMRYEYELGDFLGDNIDFTITINTKSGFEQNKITQLKVIRYKGTAAAKEELNTKTIVSIGNYGTYDVTFLGSDLTKDAVPSTGGTQIFEVIGLLADGTEYDGGSVLATTDGATTEPEILVADLNYVLSKATVTEFTWTVTGASEVRFDMSEARKSKYTLSIDPTRPVIMTPGAVTSEYTFKYVDDDTPFTVEGVTTFKLDQPDKSAQVFLMYGTKGDTTTGIVTRDGGVLTGALVLKDPRYMSGAEFNMAKVAITPVTPVTPVVPVVPTELIRPYPPKPYPGPASGEHEKRNTFEWTVSGADYGNGLYKVVMSDSMNWQVGVNDAEGFFDEGELAQSQITGAYTGGPLGTFQSAYSATETVMSWTHFYLPVAISLNRLRIYPRASGEVESKHFASKWNIYGIDRSTGAPVETILFSTTNATFPVGPFKEFFTTAGADKKFKEFKVDFVAGQYWPTAIQEMIFYGHE